MRQATFVSLTKVKSITWRVEEGSLNGIALKPETKLLGKMPTQMSRLIKQLYQIKATTFQVGPAKDDRVAISRAATQTLDHVWGPLELIFLILQVLAFRQSNKRTVPHKHLKNSTMQGRGNGVRGIAFNIVTMKQVQPRVNVTRKHGG